MSGRPTPVTVTDELLSYVLDELQGLRADLAGKGGAADLPADGTVELREPPARKSAGRRKS